MRSAGEYLWGAAVLVVFMAMVAATLALACLAADWAIARIHWLAAIPAGLATLTLGIAAMLAFRDWAFRDA
jgi:hypothetical protein